MKDVEVRCWRLLKESLPKKFKGVLHKVRGEGNLEDVTTPAPPYKNFDRTLQGVAFDQIYDVKEIADGVKLGGEMLKFIQEWSSNSSQV